jgi:hypothetical protein
MKYRYAQKYLFLALCLLLASITFFSCKQERIDGSAVINKVDNSKPGTTDSKMGSVDYHGVNSIAKPNAAIAESGAEKLANSSLTGTNTIAKMLAPAVISSTGSNTIENTDYRFAGVGALRDVGSGTISLSGVTGTITKAYLYWSGETNSLTDAGNNITVNGTAVAGTNIGYAFDNAWGYQNSQAYRADVTALVSATGNGNYSLAGFGNMNPDGASLIVFYDDGNSANNRDVAIFEGNDSNGPFAGISGNPNAPADNNYGWDDNLTGINYTSGTANLQLHVADGQAVRDGSVLINNTELIPAGENFDGNTVPGANNGPTNNGRLWDIRSFDITSFLSAGVNSLHLTSGIYSDFLALIVAVVDVPSSTINVPLDIQPQSCPNEINPKSKGVTPAAILGTSGLDVSKIDPSTIKLNGVSPLRWSIEDVAAPFTGKVTDCSSCTTAGPDGIADLTLKFDTQALITAIGSFSSGQCVSVEITGKLLPQYGGKSIKGTDKVSVL